MTAALDPFDLRDAYDELVGHAHHSILLAVAGDVRGADDEHRAAEETRREVWLSLDEDDYAAARAWCRAAQAAVVAARQRERLTTVECRACDGRGTVYDPGDPASGYGPIEDAGCPECHGRGRVAR